jgi:branched-chain amino acid aminotransferase
MKRTIERPDLDWKNLPFNYVRTDYNIRYHWKEGQWGEGELVSEDSLQIHMSAPALHYGQQAFEGLKAFETRDGRVVTFRPDENGKRLQWSSRRIFMPEIPVDMFIDAVRRVVEANQRFVPPHGTGASLYIRPLVIGTGAKVGLGPAEEYLFIVFTTPVGPYYKGGFKPVHALVVEEYDRAAPLGVGDCKVGGNYAAGLAGSQYARDEGYPVALYLDAREKKWIDEFSTSNLIAVRGNTYVTPDSRTILPSITNRSLEVLARDMGMDVERRPVSVDELESFDEVGAVGTAAVITPVNRIHYRGKDFLFGRGDDAGPVITALYDRLTRIQTGDLEDTHGWLYEV